MKRTVERKEYSPCPLCKGGSPCPLCKGEGKYVSASLVEVVITSDAEEKCPDEIIDAEVDVKLIEG